MRAWLKHIVTIIFGWCLLVEMVESFAGRHFNMVLDGDWYLLLTGSSKAAMGEFLKLYLSPLSMLVITYILLVAGFIVLMRKVKLRGFVVVLAVLLGLVTFRVIEVGRLAAWKPVYVAYDTLRGMKLYSDIAKAGVWTPERAAKVKTISENATNYVFVIGESMTSYRLSFYGYEKHTTPRLEALGDKLAKLGPVKVLSPYTVLALPSLFMRDGVSAPICFRQAGYETFFVGSHHRWARYCSVESSVFDACEHKVYLSEVKKDQHIYDEMLLPYVKEMVSGSRPFVLFVHIMGSHFDPKDRVPKDFENNDEFDDYDRSILYTDKVMSEIIKLLPEKTTLYYISDHGESTDTAGWRDMHSKALLTVPVMMYPSDGHTAINSVAEFTSMWYNLSHK